MKNQYKALGLSFLLLMSSGSVVRAAHLEDAKTLEGRYLAIKAFNGGTGDTSDAEGVKGRDKSDYAFQSNSVNDAFIPLEFQFPEVTDQDPISNVDTLVGGDLDFSTRALDLYVPFNTERSEYSLDRNGEVIAQDAPSESEVEGTESEVVEEAESEEESGFTFPGEISATATITTNYVFRGISQTDNNPAIQASFDYNVGLVDDLDFYAGIWGSNIDFGDEADFGGESLGTLELDFYGGVTYAVTEKASIGGSIVYYFYPGADGSLDFDYIEFGFDAGYDFGPVSTTLNFAYSPDFFGGSEDGFYVVGAAEAPLPFDLSISGGLGFQAISDNDTFGTPDYLEWNIGVGYAIAGFDLLLQYIDTDLSNSECFGGTDLCDARVVFSASRTF